MPEPLVCEDTSLERLMDTVHETPGARILYQDTVRKGGVLGFFAREVHRVAYIGEGEAIEIPGLTLPATTDGDDDLMLLADLVTETPIAPTGASKAASPFAALLADADAAEARDHATEDHATEAIATEAIDHAAKTIEHRDASERHAGPGTDFASVLRRYTEFDQPEFDQSQSDRPQSNQRQAGQRQSEPIETASTITSEALDLTDLWARADALDAAAVTAAPTLAEVTPIGGRGAEARSRLELLVQLRQVGVPVSVNPGTEVQSLYQALEDILDQLPPPADFPNRPGQLLAIVGESGPALRAARTTARQLRLPADQIVAAGFESEGLRSINGRRQAARLRKETVEADLPVIVVVATDDDGPEDRWAADLLDALRPDRAWVVIDARWKSEDCHGLLDRLPSLDGLVVQAAELSTSPASVWDLDLPVALLDDRRPSTFVWLTLLMRLFDADGQRRTEALPQRHLATA